ncbi:MAG: hypothetical protein FGM57_02155 [Candidatus Taylorbacteria bacterium]|nr:hypothetical protein [Candidatus Taylorbacteria bacterium]
MKNIGDFLSKFKIIRNPKENREQISIILKNSIQLDVSESEIKVEKGVIYLYTHPAVKNVIFLNKEKILVIIKEKLPDLYVVDIR